MTSINAIKFNDYAGACVCDEARCWNDEAMKIYTAEKMKPCVPDGIVEKYGTVAVYGNTGTSTLGDEIKWAIKKHLTEELEKRIEKCGKHPDTFVTMEEMARMVFGIMCRIKHDHIDSQLKGLFGFDTPQFVRGFYNNPDKIEIREKEVIDEALKYITWKDDFAKVNGVFVNCGILAGYDDLQGFNLYHYSLIEAFWEQVQAAFIVDGSGRDAAGMVLGDKISRRTIPDRGEIDPAEGMIMMLEAVNEASRFNLGVEGYYNIILIDGKKPKHRDRIREINDHRSKLASEIVSAASAGFVSNDAEYQLIKDLLFCGSSFREILSRFTEQAKDKKGLSLHLRGYKK